MLCSIIATYVRRRLFVQYCQCHHDVFVFHTLEKFLFSAMNYYYYYYISTAAEVQFILLVKSHN